MIRCNNCFELIEESYKACPYCGYIKGTPPEQPYHLAPGMELAGRYIVGAVLGFGGFGVTYKAWDSKLETIVAIKEFFMSSVVNRSPGEKEVAIYARKHEKDYIHCKERFLEEAKNMAKFSSEPNIVNVFEYFEENNTAYIVMEFLDGISLKGFLKDNGGKIDVDTALEIMESICGALITIHSTGIIHRDVSPDNIFLCTGGAIKLIDFGAARFSQDENKSMTIILKPGFAPPEQYDTINKQGPWTDVYALGATLYYVITGQKPEESTNRKINDTTPYPHELDPEIPEYLSNTIMKAMAIDINLRFKDVKEFHEALRQQRKVLPVAVEKKKRTNRRNIGVSVAAIAIVLGVTLSVVSLNNRKEKETLPPCDLEMWYCLSGDSELDEAEQAAYETIVEQFKTSFPDVNIELKSFTESEYEKALKSEDEIPNLYEYNGKLSSGTPLALDKVYKSISAENCSVLTNADAYFGDFNYIPLGFSAPIVFQNTSNSDYDKKVVKSLDDISGDDDDQFVNDYEYLKKMYSDAGDYTVSAAMSEFYKNNAAFYGTTTRKYNTIREDIPGQYKLIHYDAEKIYCVYDDVWTANDTNKKENKAVIKLLEFMLSSNAQDILHIQNLSESLPVNDEVIELYTTVYNDFSEFFDNKSNYVFEK